VDDFNGKAPLPSAPTAALPGTPEKVAVLEQRARLRQALWHPLDAPVSRGGYLLDGARSAAV
jgi:hypothetical protein